MHIARAAREPASALLAAMILAFFGLPAAATGDFAERVLSDADRARLAAHEAIRVTTRAAIAGDADPEAVATLDALLDAPALPIRGADIRGDYRCRTIKLGGPVPLVIYAWFDCRVDEDDVGYRLVKTTGSQRLAGHFIDTAEDRLTYWGALHYADETPVAYGSDPERDQVGFMFRIGEAAYRLELPLPRFESRFDILELRPG